MRRYPPSSFGASFGPGPITPAVKALLIANVGMFLLSWMWPELIHLAMQPRAVLEGWQWWQPVTYMFLHAGIFHLVFNMLVLWMFGVELERLWGTRFFVKYYFIAGVGAAFTMMVLSFTPFAFADRMYDVRTVGASGAIFGLLLAYGLYFPTRRVYMYFLFPVQAKYFVMIIGAITLLATISDQRGGVAHAAHLGGLLVGYVYLKAGHVRFHPIAELRYRYLKWKINRMRRRFDVYSGGRGKDVDRRLH